MNKIKNTSMRMLLLACFGLMLGISCTNAGNQASAQSDPDRSDEASSEIIEAHIISPADESSFAEGDNILLQWEQADANVQQPNVYLDSQKIDIVVGDMLPELPVGEHTLKLGLKEDILDQVTFHVSKFMGYTLRFKANGISYGNGHYYDFRGCLPENGLKTTLIQDVPKGQDFLLKIFTASQEWNDLLASWREPDPNYRGGDRGYRPACSSWLNTPRSQLYPGYMHEFFVDFRITKGDFFDTKFFKNAVQINFKPVDMYMPNRHRATDDLITSSSAWQRFWLTIPVNVRGVNMPEPYKTIDFSKKSIVTFAAEEAYPGIFSGCGIQSVHGGLVAIYEWNERLYVIKKRTEKEALFPFGACRALIPLKPPNRSILIVDYAKDKHLPVEFITIP